MERIATLILRPSNYQKRGDVFAADSGALSVLERKDPLCAAVGDFDSVSLHQAHDIQAYAQKTYLHPIKKDKSDGELAIDLCLSLGYTTIYVYGGFGDRIDHQHVHLVLALQHPELIFVSETQELQSYGLGKHEIQKDGFDSFSVFSFEEAEIKLESCEYPLERTGIDWKNTLSLSNAWKDQNALLTVYQGKVWVSKNR